MLENVTTQEDLANYDNINLPTLGAAVNAAIWT